jgi:hypothetical protein
MNPEILTREDEIEYQCRHIFTDGRRCASPALRAPEGRPEDSQPFCYFHHTSRRPIQHAPARKRRRSTFTLTHTTDLAERSGIQLAIGDVLRLIASNEIDPRRAGLLLYGLQIASQTLPKANPKEQPKEPISEVILDPEHGLLAPPAELGHDEPKGTLERWMDELDAEDEHAQAEKARLEQERADREQLEHARQVHEAITREYYGLDIKASAQTPAPPPRNTTNAPIRHIKSNPNFTRLKILRKNAGEGVDYPQLDGEIPSHSSAGHSCQPQDARRVPRPVPGHRLLRPQ